MRGRIFVHSAGMLRRPFLMWNSRHVPWRTPPGRIQVRSCRWPGSAIGITSVSTMIPVLHQIKLPTPIRPNTAESTNLRADTTSRQVQTKNPVPCPKRLSPLGNPTMH